MSRARGSQFQEAAQAVFFVAVTITLFWLYSFVSRVLTIEEAKTQYVQTLDNLARTAIFQYTFVATSYYFSGFTEPGNTPSFLGFEFSAIEWVFIGLLGVAVLNFYITRQLQLLTVLLKMYPSQRRKLRFLTWHHYWPLNPFRARRIIYSRKTLKSKQFVLWKFRRFRLYPMNGYSIVEFSAVFYLMNLFGDWWETRDLTISQMLTNSPLLIALFLIATISGAFLNSRLARHQYAMWGYVYPFRF